MIENGIETFIEIGPGKVLAGLIKRINKDIKTINIENSDDIHNFLTGDEHGE